MGKHKDQYAGGINPSRSGSGSNGKPLNAGGRYGYRMDFRRQEAQERAEFRATLTPQQQLDRLDERLGSGVGAGKERKRLRAEIENAKAQRQAKKNREHSAKIAAEVTDAG
jgi:hypothetical protein